jgi:hypothetical protein
MSWSCHSEVFELRLNVPVLRQLSHLLCPVSKYDFASRRLVKPRCSFSDQADTLPGFGSATLAR